MSAEHKFQVNLRGVIDLLSHHLYSGPHVYLRELLQNAVDAITARTQLDPQHVGEVRLELMPARDRQPATLLMHDNGVGLTEDEVHRFLAIIGQSSKREALHREDFIGQFGIGLLSCFMVSHEIAVVTRSAQPDSKPVEWRGRSDGTYTIRTLDHEGEPGTQVYLRAKPGCEEFFEADYILRTARHYGSLLPSTIRVATPAGEQAINEEAPWRIEYDSRDAQREAFLDYGRRVLETEFFDALPLTSEVGGVEGIAFVLPFSPSLAAKRTHRVYLKNMLLSEQADNLLPDWAFFVKCVINAQDLRPTASREGFYEDDSLTEARGSLGNCLRQYLVRLSREDRPRLDTLIGIHYLAIKALALDDEEFYRLFIELLPFETSLGEMTLGEYLKKYPLVQYVRTRDQFRQISGVASAQSRCIINGGYTYDTDLLERLPQVFPNRHVERLDGSDLAESFDELTLNEREAAFELVKLADLALQPFRCTAQIKKFEPSQLPALYTINDAANFLRSVEQSKEVADELWSGVLDGVAEIPASSSMAQLCLNYKNPLIRKMARLGDRRRLQRAIEMLYVQALLLGHYPLKAQEMRLLNDGLLALIEQGIEGG